MARFLLSPFPSTDRLPLLQKGPRCPSFHPPSAPSPRKLSATNQHVQSCSSRHAPSGRLGRARPSPPISRERATITAMPTTSLPCPFPTACGHAGNALIISTCPPAISRHQTLWLRCSAEHTGNPPPSYILLCLTMPWASPLHFPRNNHPHRPLSPSPLLSLIPRRVPLFGTGAPQFLLALPIFSPLPRLPPELHSLLCSIAGTPSSPLSSPPILISAPPHIFSALPALRHPASSPLLAPPPHSMQHRRGNRPANHGTALPSSAACEHTSNIPCMHDVQIAPSLAHFHCYIPNPTLSTANRAAGHSLQNTQAALTPLHPTLTMHFPCTTSPLTGFPPSPFPLITHPPRSPSSPDVATMQSTESPMHQAHEDVCHHGYRRPHNGALRSNASVATTTSCGLPYSLAAITVGAPALDELMQAGLPWPQPRP